MPQAETWEREYRRPQLLTKKSGPRTDVKDFLKWLRRQADVDLAGLAVLDLGSGTGRNGNYLAERGARVTGLELSPTAVELARSRARELGIEADYRIADFGTTLPFADASFDVGLDVMSSNSLNEEERSVYLKEARRVLKPGAYFFVRALCKEGDHNAKNLLRDHPGPEVDTYINEDLGLVERIFSREDFITTYAPFFEIVRLEKKTNYTRFRGQPYKRNYWLAYLRKPLSQ